MIGQVEACPAARYAQAFRGQLSAFSLGAASRKQKMWGML
jgi:hypothetical protein